MGVLKNWKLWMRSKRKHFKRSMILFHDDIHESWHVNFLVAHTPTEVWSWKRRPWTWVSDKSFFQKMILAALQSGGSRCVFFPKLIFDKCEYFAGCFSSSLRTWIFSFFDLVSSSFTLKVTIEFCSLNWMFIFWG